MYITVLRPKRRIDNGNGGLLIALLLLTSAFLGCEPGDRGAGATGVSSTSAENNSETVVLQDDTNDGGASVETASTANRRTTGESEHSSVTVERVTTVRETTTTETQRETGEQPVVAIFIKNRAGSEYDEKIIAMEDLLSSRLAEEGFRVMSREDVINAAPHSAMRGPTRGIRTRPGRESTRRCPTTPPL
jgi:hypothetical protein